MVLNCLNTCVDVLITASRVPQTRGSSSDVPVLAYGSEVFPRWTYTGTELGGCRRQATGDIVIKLHERSEETAARCSWSIGPWLQPLLTALRRESEFSRKR